MATSGVTAWPMTARDIIRQALLEAKIIAGGEQPTADEVTDAIVRLNGLLKTWAARGINEWREVTLTVPVDAATATVELPSGVDNVLDVRLVTSVTYQRPLARWERSEYQILPNKASAGDPVAYSVTRTIGGMALTLWPVAAAGIVLAVDVNRSVETVTDANQSVDFPERFQDALILNLALRCARPFGAAVDPVLLADAKDAERVMFDADRPESYTLEPDY